MKLQNIKIVLLCGWLLVESVANAEQRVALPMGYTDNYFEYLSLDRTIETDQIMRIYANDIAMQGPDVSGELPSGSIIVGEVYSVQKDADGNVIVSSLGRRIENDLILVAVMEKRTGFANSSTSRVATGDWDFGAFKADGSVAPKELDECRVCHAPLKDYEFMFSLEHLPIRTPHDTARQ